MIELYLRLYRWWLTWPQKIRFLLVGGYNTLFSYLLFAGILWLLGGKHEQGVLLVSFMLSSVNSFITQKVYVFCTKGNWISEFVKCLGTWMISYVINAVLLWLLVEWMTVNPYVAQIYALVLLTIFSWVMLKHFAFKQKRV